MNKKILFVIVLLAILLVMVYDSSKKNKILAEKIRIDDIIQDSLSKVRAKNFELKKQQIKKNKIKLLPRLRKTVDDVENITFYQDRSTSIYFNNTFYMYFYIMGSSQPVPKFRVSFVSDDWLFIQSITIKVDDKKYYINEGSGNINGVRKVLDDGDVYEEINPEFNKEIEKMIIDIINSKSTKIRLNGQDYYKDRTLSRNEILALKRVYETFKGISL